MDSPGKWTIFLYFENAFFQTFSVQSGRSWSKVHFNTVGPSTMTARSLPTFHSRGPQRRTVHFSSNDRLIWPFTAHFRLFPVRPSSLAQNRPFFERPLNNPKLSFLYYDFYNMLRYSHDPMFLKLQNSVLEDFGGENCPRRHSLYQFMLAQDRFQAFWLVGKVSDRRRLLIGLRKL